jgi:hypothetical protein
MSIQNEGDFRAGVSHTIQAKDMLSEGVEFLLFFDPGAFDGVTLSSSLICLLTVVKAHRGLDKFIEGLMKDEEASIPR